MILTAGAVDSLGHVQVHFLAACVIHTSLMAAASLLAPHFACGALGGLVPGGLV